MTDTVRDEAIALYGLPREEFTRARNDRAKELQREGKREAAAAVRALSKPDQVAAAINWAVRERPDLRDELLGAGERLRKASGRGRGEELRKAMGAERAAVARLVAIVESHIGNRARLDDAALTLHAATTDEEVRDRVREGRLLAKATPSQTFALGSGVRATTPQPTGHTKLKRAREAERKGLAAQRVAEKEAQAAERAVERAERELRRLETRRRTSRARADKARAAAEAAARHVRELSKG